MLNEKTKLILKQKIIIIKKNLNFNKIIAI